MNLPHNQPVIILEHSVLYSNFIGTRFCGGRAAVAQQPEIATFFHHQSKTKPFLILDIRAVNEVILVRK